jgi:hypothetical protein
VSPSKSRESRKEQSPSKKTPSKHNVPQFVKSIDEKKTQYKNTKKGFTLTDHFKLYGERKNTE